MASRILVQAFIIVIMTLVTYFVAHDIDKITIPPLNVVLMVLAAALGGFSFLGLGQLVVGYIKSSESVNAIVRLLYFPFAVLGAIGEIGIFGNTVKQIVEWSPFGTTKTILSAAMGGAIPPHTVWLSVLATFGYGLILAGIGIKRFQWSIN